MKITFFSNSSSLGCSEAITPNQHSGFAWHLTAAALATLLSASATAQSFPSGANDPDMAGARREVDALLAQPGIDPLTSYLESHGSQRSGLLDRVRVERDRRCSLIANSFAARAKTAENLKMLEADFRDACPAVVKAFSEQVNGGSVPAKPGETSAGGSPAAVPAAP